MLSRMTARTLRQHKPDYRTLSSSKSSSKSSTTTPVAVATVSQVFKAWPQETKGVVMCYGDYRQEAWLEKHIGGPLYAHQDALPRLPAPTLHDTLQRFLPTATPLATTPFERQELERKARAFAQQAAQLQERLVQRAQEANNSNSSWLQHWWNHLAYLEYRDSVVINVSYFFHQAYHLRFNSRQPRFSNIF